MEMIGLKLEKNSGHIKTRNQQLNRFQYIYIHYSKIRKRPKKVSRQVFES